MPTIREPNDEPETTAAHDDNRDLTEYSYEVILSNTFEARSPEQAARYMIEWLQDTDFWGMTYRVQREHQDAVDYIDHTDIVHWEEHGA